MRKLGIQQKSQVVFRSPVVIIHVTLHLIYEFMHMLFIGYNYYVILLLCCFGFSYFGLRYYGQCWSGATADQTYSRDGPDKRCVRGVGLESTYFVYKFYDYSHQGEKQGQVYHFSFPYWKKKAYIHTLKRRDM